ncbi:M28 family peptidase [Caulobacter mirabilis]|uniref:Carboxypeptidase Q n=1 Tax=Caulobacter mirabilis TaxID=69666 RepID=A0A2D2B0L8_9CAUL|nr:M28 family peptidase [Caulobacter mirabilis]ATQ43794.1 peptidase M28 family protein [Caulobacter mirabilis]
MRISLLALAASLALSTAAVAAEPVDTAAALRDKALVDQTAWTVLDDLTTGIGPRPVGSPAMARAKDWGVDTLKKLGFENIRVEEFAKPSWARGPESASVVAPYPFRLSIIGLGNSVPTPAKGIEAEIVVFKAYADLLAAPAGSLNGKIAVVTQAMTRTQDGQGYGAAGVARRSGPSEAAKRGAVAYLVRSISTSDSRLAHTGGTRYAEGVARIPAAALGVPDADLLERLAARGPVKVKLAMASTTSDKTVAWNISGDIPGSEKPEEVIVIGGHLDSWDVGTGAIDDASGIAITTAAAKLIGDLPRHPRRTIRVVMWGSEETGGSSEAYAKAHKDILGNIITASESDLGADRVYALQLPKGAAATPLGGQLASLLAPLKVIVSREEATFGGSDVEGLQDAGVPVFGLRQDASRYFDLHHSEDDTIDKVDPRQLSQNVAAWASTLYMIADSDIDFRALKDSK